MNILQSIRCTETVAKSILRAVMSGEVPTELIEPVHIFTPTAIGKTINAQFVIAIDGQRNRVTVDLRS